ncbi:MAG: substrate-binding domain-containing protein [Butyricicoccus pullicaecorum]
MYPAAVLTNAAQAEEAQAFLDYLKTDKAMDVFASVGFSHPDEA